MSYLYKLHQLDAFLGERIEMCECLRDKITSSLEESRSPNFQDSRLEIYTAIIVDLKRERERIRESIAEYNT